MKCISVFLLSVAALSAADFTNGQAARLVIGQTTFTSQDPNSSDTIVGGVSGLAFGADTLFVVDSNRVGAGPINHRVLMFKGASSQFPSPTAQLDYSRKCPACVGQANVVLGQPDFTTTTENVAATASALRQPTAVATDGVHVVVADTNHNRVLIWNRIPTGNNQPADVVLGEPNFTTATLPAGNTPTAASMRGPQGVWIQNGKLYVADTQNNRVLIFNTIPTTNGASADVVLGAPNFTTFVQPDLTQQTSNVTASIVLNPVSVTSDGTRLFVTDLGYNRVLVWNSIPSSNGAAADFALGQPDLVSSTANNAFTTDANGVETAVLCTTSNGTDSNGNPTYPYFCNSTLNFPRFALSTGTKLFIADGGNDRILVYNTMPTKSGTPADAIIGQYNNAVIATDAADGLRTPMGMAWDGTNLYVSDAYNRRVTVYSMGQTTVPYQGVRNSASIAIYARGSVTIGGTITAGDIITLEIGTATLSTSTTNTNGTTTTTTSTNPKYTYTVKSTDTLATVTQGLVDSINNSNSGAGDPNVRATPNLTDDIVILTAIKDGSDGNSINYQTTISTNATIAATVAQSTLTGGGDAASVAPGTIVSILGTNLSAGITKADFSQPSLPTTLGGTQVYFNGIRAPLYYVSPTQINAQVPWEVNDTTSINAYVRSVMSDGSVVNTTPVAVTIVPANPGIYAQSNTSGVGQIFHGSSSATGIVSVDGTVTAGDTATITVEDRTYTYTVQAGDTLDSIRDSLIALLNQDPKVSAQAAGVYDRIIISSRIQGPEGNGIAVTASASSSATVIMTAFANTLCCANVDGALVTPQNPAMPGEIVYIFATGLGLPVLSDSVSAALQTGVPYPASAPATVVPGDSDHSLSGLAGGSTADVISASLVPGSVGTYKVVLHLNSALAANSAMQMTIAQSTYVSNIVTFPLNYQSTSSASTTSGASTPSGSSTQSSAAPGVSRTRSGRSSAAPQSLKQGRTDRLAVKGQ
jgi:uncharacterized protein (TIGR03437 family)